MQFIACCKFQFIVLIKNRLTRSNKTRQRDGRGARGVGCLWGEHGSNERRKGNDSNPKMVGRNPTKWMRPTEEAQRNERAFVFSEGSEGCGACADEAPPPSRFFPHSCRYKNGAAGGSTSQLEQSAHAEYVGNYKFVTACTARQGCRALRLQVQRILPFRKCLHGRTESSATTEQIQINRNLNLRRALRVCHCEEDAMT